MSGRCTDSYCDNMNPSHRCNDSNYKAVKKLTEYSSNELQYALNQKIAIEKMTEESLKMAKKKAIQEEVLLLENKLEKLRKELQE